MERLHTPAFFKTLFESSPALILVLNPALDIVAVTDAFLNATLSDRKQIIGKNVLDVYAINPDQLFPDAGERLLQSLQEVLATKKEHHLDVLRYDVRDKDGTYREKFWRPVNTPVLDVKGEVAFIFHQVEDLTAEVRLRREAAIITRRYEQQLEALNRDLETQVRVKTEQLTGLFDRMNDGFIALDKNFCYTFVNRNICELLGQQPENLLGRNVWDVFPDAVGSATYNAFVAAMETQQPVVNTDYYAGLDLWQENHIYPSAEGLSVFIRNISERRKAEDMLIASEQKYRYLFEKNPVPMWMISLPERNFLAVNNAAVDLYGYSRDEFLNMNARDIRPTEDVERFEKQTAFLQPGIYRAGIWRHRKKDGTIIQVEITAHDNFYEGKPARLILAQDVTERLKAEEGLRQSEEINRLIMSSSLNAIVCMDTDGNIIFWNPQAERVFGWEREEVVGRPLAATIIPVRQRDMIRKGVQHYLATGSDAILKRLIETKAIHKDGHEFFVELAIIPVRESGKEFFCSFIQDITERKKAEEQLRDSHEQLRQLASHLQDVREEEQKRIAREVHDELGQQITGLKMDVAWIWKKIAALGGIESIETRLKEMVELLDAAVKTIRKISSELRPGILDDMGLVAALEWQALEFQKRFQIPIEFKAPSRQQELDAATATGLFRLFQESLTNIARHSGATHVAAEMVMSDNDVTLIISDNGKGFDTEAQQGKKTLGLLGMRERALMMNGKLVIESKPGAGTTVKIYVPIAEPVKSP